MLSDMVPIFIDKWSDLHGRPQVQQMQQMEEQFSSINQKVERMENRIFWLTIFLILMALWSAILTTLYFLKV